MKLIKVTAVWCLSCILMNERINNAIKGKNIDLIEYDYDDDEDIIKKYNIGKILPVLIITDDNGKELKRSTGEKTEKELNEFLEKGEEKWKNIY